MLLCCHVVRCCCLWSGGQSLRLGHCNLILYFHWNSWKAICLHAWFACWLFVCLFVCCCVCFNVLPFCLLTVMFSNGVRKMAAINAKAPLQRFPKVTRTTSMRLCFVLVRLQQTWFITFNYCTLCINKAFCIFLLRIKTRGTFIRFVLRFGSVVPFVLSLFVTLVVGGGGAVALLRRNQLLNISFRIA